MAGGFMVGKNQAGRVKDVYKRQVRLQPQRALSGPKASIPAPAPAVWMKPKAIFDLLAMRQFLYEKRPIQ